MDELPILRYCAICGKGINLVKRETVYRCPHCKQEVCGSCYEKPFRACQRCKEKTPEYSAKQKELREAEEQARREEARARADGAAGIRFTCGCGGALLGGIAGAIYYAIAQRPDTPWWWGGLCVGVVCGLAGLGVAALINQRS